MLIGHDWGAATTWGLTAVAPTRFARHVAMAVPPGPALLRTLRSPRGLALAARQAPRSWYMLYNQVPGAERGLDRVIPRLWSDWSPGYDAREDVPRVLEALDGPGRRRAALKYYRDTARHGLAGALATPPGAPVLYLHGERDGCLRPDFGERHPEVLAPGSSFRLVPGAGHFLHLEQPQHVAGLIGDWIGSAG